MNRNPLTLGRKALVQQLGTVTVANGCATNAGHNVRTGWFNEVLKSDDIGFPIICLQKGKDLAPKAAAGALIKFNGFYVIGAVDVGLDAYEDALDDLEHDLLCVLMPAEGQFPRWLPRGIKGITVGAPEQFPPGNGERAASVLIPVHLHTIIER